MFYLTSCNQNSISIITNKTINLNMSIRIKDNIDENKCPIIAYKN